MTIIGGLRDVPTSTGYPDKKDDVPIFNPFKAFVIHLKSISIPINLRI